MASYKLLESSVGAPTAVTTTPLVVQVWLCEYEHKGKERIHIHSCTQKCCSKSFVEMTNLFLAPRHLETWEQAHLCWSHSVLRYHMTGIPTAQNGWVILAAYIVPRDCVKYSQYSSHYSITISLTAVKITRVIPVSKYLQTEKDGRKKGGRVPNPGTVLMH